MELVALRTFVTLIEAGGVLPASQRLNTVQSNVTARIKKLEQSLGTQLFLRVGRRLVVTPSGRLFQRYARQILLLEAEARHAMSSVGRETGVFRLGVMEVFAAFRLPKLLQEFRLIYPNIELVIETATSAALVARVLDHQIDAAFVGGPVRIQDLKVTEVLNEELVLVRSSTTELEHARNMIVFKEGCAYRARAMNWMREQGCLNLRIMEMGSLDAILGCVEAGVGVTLMPRSLLAQSRYVNGLELGCLPAHIANAPTVFVQNIRSGEAPALEHLVGLLKRKST